MSPKPKEPTREEDYRDYEERDLEEGWPYDDAAGEGAPARRNRPYGEPGANFDAEANKGYTVTDADADGQQESQSDSLLPGTRGREVEDDLEERVTDALGEIEGVDLDLIDVTAEGGLVILEGDVDDAATARRLAARALTIAGVRDVRNNIRVLGVDANLPDDD